MIRIQPTEIKIRATDIDYITVVVNARRKARATREAEESAAAELQAQAQAEVLAAGAEARKRKAEEDGANLDSDRSRILSPSDEELTLEERASVEALKRAEAEARIRAWESSDEETETPDMPQSMTVRRQNSHVTPENLYAPTISTAIRVPVPTIPTSPSPARPRALPVLLPLSARRRVHSTSDDREAQVPLSPQELPTPLATRIPLPTSVTTARQIRVGYRPLGVQPTRGIPRAQRDGMVDTTRTLSSIPHRTSVRGLEYLPTQSPPSTPATQNGFPPQWATSTRSSSDTNDGQHNLLGLRDENSDPNPPVPRARSNGIGVPLPRT